MNGLYIGFVGFEGVSVFTFLSSNLSCSPSKGSRFVGVVEIFDS